MAEQPSGRRTRDELPSGCALIRWFGVQPCERHARLMGGACRTRGAPSADVTSTGRHGHYGSTLRCRLPRWRGSPVVLAPTMTDRARD